MAYEKRPEPDEPVFIISVAAQMVGLHPQTLRSYERLGLIRPQRSSGRVRLYSQHDIEALRRISRLTDELGVNLAGVEVILNLTRRLEEMQQEMEEMERAFQEELDKLHRRLQEAGS